MTPDPIAEGLRLAAQHDIGIAPKRLLYRGNGSVVALAPGEVPTERGATYHIEVECHFPDLAREVVALREEAATWKALATMCRESFDVHSLIIFNTGETWAKTFDAALAAAEGRKDG